MDSFFKTPGALGTLEIPLWDDKHYIVTGGPFNNCPDRMVGVKMAREIRRQCDIDIGTEDFSTPEPDKLRAGLTKAVLAMVSGKPLYVGCMAGRGRTGLFLSVLAKAFGIQNPVEYVRKHYYPHAVETAEQYRFVMEFPIPLAVRFLIGAARGKAFFTRKICLTNHR